MRFGGAEMNKELVSISRSSEARGDIAVPMAGSNSGGRRAHGSRGERVISSDLGVSSGPPSPPSHFRSVALTHPRDLSESTPCGGKSLDSGHNLHVTTLFIQQMLGRLFYQCGAQHQKKKKKDGQDRHEPSLLA